MATYPITKRGAEMLKAELHKLKTVERPAVIQAIAEARAQGDLSENADYDAAKERQGFIEGRIQEIEGKLSVCQIINPAELDAGENESYANGKGQHFYALYQARLKTLNACDFGDLLLHDGEPRGTRILDGVETPVFDELELLAPSDLHTFTASVSAPRRADLQELEARADEARIPFEDWTSSIRFLCKCCSEGSPGQHEHHHEAQDEWKNLRSVAMAARTAECAQALLSDWSHAGTGRRADALVCALRRPPS